MAWREKGPMLLAAPSPCQYSGFDATIVALLTNSGAIKPK